MVSGSSFTKVFAPAYNNEGEILNRQGVLGMCVGFFCFGAFFFYSIILLIIDDRDRHNRYEADINRSKDILRSEYSCEEHEIEKMVAEFELQQKNGKKLGDEIALRN